MTSLQLQETAARAERERALVLITFVGRKDRTSSSSSRGRIIGIGEHAFGFGPGGQPRSVRAVPWESVSAILIVEALDPEV